MTVCPEGWAVRKYLRRGETKSRPTSIFSKTVTFSSVSEKVAGKPSQKAAKSPATVGGGEKGRGAAWGKSAENRGGVPPDRGSGTLEEIRSIMERNEKERGFIGQIAERSTKTWTPPFLGRLCGRVFLGRISLPEDFLRGRGKDFPRRGQNNTARRVPRPPS